MTEYADDLTDEDEIERSRANLQITETEREQLKRAIANDAGQGIFPSRTWQVEMAKLSRESNRRAIARAMREEKDRH